MDITKIIGIGIIGTILSVTVKKERPELGLCISVASGIAILALVLPHLQTAVNDMYELCTENGVSSDCIKTIIKITGIAYTAQIAAELAKDAGEGATAKKIEFAGKILILAVIMPTVKNTLNVIISMLYVF